MWINLFFEMTKHKQRHQQQQYGRRQLSRVPYRVFLLVRRRREKVEVDVIVEIRKSRGGASGPTAMGWQLRMKLPAASFVLSMASTTTATTTTATAAAAPAHKEVSSW